VTFSLDELEHPIILAPLAGGPSTPELAAAVSDAGGLGFLAAGYRTATAVRDEIAAIRASTARAFGVNVFAPPGPPGDEREVARYAQSLRAEAARYGAELGEPRHHDDAFAEKVDLLVTEAVPVVSFTFGCPAAAVVERLHGAGSAVWVTVTSAGEAERAAAVGADALVVQGIEAGGHRGGFDDRAPADVGLLALLQLVRARTGLPLVATGGLATGAAIAAVLVAGAGAAQLGSAFLRTPEAGTSAAHRDALEAGQEPTRVTRAFTGRHARGIVNRFMTAHEHAAPSAYPEVHHLTAPLRAAAREQGDRDGINLWAGQAYGLGTDEPAGELVRRLAADARAALEPAARRLGR
jgi:nitronate monooxygenase